jgi:sensor c-di-GMP phosphodiesterase-like protein
MAHSLRLKVIAEGVEFTEQANFLRKHNCDQFQGYLVTPPIAAGEFLDFLKRSE